MIRLIFTYFVDKYYLLSQHDPIYFVFNFDATLDYEEYKSTLC